MNQPINQGHPKVRNQINNKVLINKEQLKQQPNPKKNNIFFLKSQPKENKPTNNHYINKLQEPRNILNITVFKVIQIPNKIFFVFIINRKHYEEHISG
jgi:hypothetical protein